MTSDTKGKRAGRLVEGGLYLLDGAAAFGLISGAALVSALGQFLLGGVLGLLGLAVFLRFKRRARNKKREQANS